MKWANAAVTTAGMGMQGVVVLVRGKVIIPDSAMQEGTGAE